MPRDWSIEADWALLESGSPEERAGFAALNITAYGTCLTAGHDRLLRSIREAPFLSAYHLAEWMAWNWWRLRWEPRKSATEWELSHAMASVGNGYIWPNIHILSDGQDITLLSKSTPERESTPYRYLSDSVSFIPASEFESETDIFIEAVLRRLEDCRISKSNLTDIWRAILEERQDPALSRQRKLEALLGEDPGEMDETSLQKLLGEAVLSGQAALEEIAANRSPGQGAPDIGALIELARREGTKARPGDRIRLSSAVDTQTKPAWEVGTEAAQSARKHFRLDPSAAIPNRSLSGFYGAPESLLESAGTLPQLDLSLSLTEPRRESRVLLRSRWGTGRRFELARLLGDHLVYATDDPMIPVTRSSTYRQKVQRAFAAEFLSPFEAVDEMLGRDYSMESQQDVAHHFDVSELTVRTMLANHNRISRGELDDVC